MTRGRIHTAAAGMWDLLLIRGEPDILFGIERGVYVDAPERSAPAVSGAGRGSKRQKAANPVLQAARR